jgi:RNA polymerase sigma factor (sigma-70 family)
MEDSAMTEKINKQRVIKVEGRLVTVTDEVYRAYYQMDRRERYLEESDTVHGKVLYSDYDTPKTTGEEYLPDVDAVLTEDRIENNELLVQLRKNLNKLNESERELIHALFFSNGGDGMTDSKYAALNGVSQQAVTKRKNRIFAKLRNYFEN